ncbi:asparaginase [Derxia gummosa]|uniref:Asparaginase n=1 Tax=Derxia gummosa DSM 723 TaxID=1121388 RepID=A0A8B6X263_9BURK|nr:asparaginase [Derxia gummosa]
MSAVPAHVPLVVQTRGVGAAQTVEMVHHGSIAVVDAAGRLLWAAGDAQASTFTRSTLKPFQALPLVEAGGVEALGYTREEVALLCASHSGLDRQVELVAGMLARAGCAETNLRCGCHVPLHLSVTDLARDAAGLAPEARWNQLHNNCSGKHAGFLGWCRLHGAPLDGYCEEGHPLQRAIRARVAALTGLADARIAVGIDGCSAPNLALPLASIARLYALLARPDSLPAEAVAGGKLASGAALHLLAEAMAAHPELVSGPGRFDAELAAAFAPGRVIAKSGAGGLQMLALRDHGLGIAVRVADGNAAALMCATVAALGAMGLLDARSHAALAGRARAPVSNLRGTVTGEMRALPALLRVG